MEPLPKISTVPSLPDAMTNEVKRPTFKEAYNAVLANSWLAKITREEYNPEIWVEAVNHDLREANFFIQRFLSDIFILTGVRFECEGKIELNLSKSYSSLELRVKGLEYEFGCRFAQTVQQVVEGVCSGENKKYGRFLPIDHLKFIGDTCSFGHLDVDGLHKISLCNYCLRRVDDYPKKIPASAKKRLNLLSKTSMDYSPKILDGLKVHEQVIGKPRLHFEINPDPALVILVEDYYVHNSCLEWVRTKTHYVIDHWSEPFESRTQKSWKWLKASWRTMALAAISLLLFFFGVKILEAYYDLEKSDQHIHVFRMAGGVFFIVIAIFVMATAAAEPFTRWLGRYRKIKI